MVFFIFTKKKNVFKNLVPFLFILFSLSSGFSQERIKGDRNVVSKETQIYPFKKLVLSEKFDVVLIEDDNASIEIETDENLHEYLKFEVIDSVLSFKTTAKIVSSRKLEIKVQYTKELREIELLESSEVSALSNINTAVMTLKTSDNSRAYLNVRSPFFNLISNGKSKSRLNIDSKDVNLELNDYSTLEALVTCETLTANIYMHAKAILEGKSNQLLLNTIASSDFEGKNLTVNTCTLNAEDTSDITLNVIEVVTINASGNSDVILYGNAKVNLETFTGSAMLQKKEL